MPAEGGVSLPDAAVLLIDGKQVVFVEEAKGRFARHAVHAEELGDGRLWVREGLAQGARVVVEGGLLLQQLVTTRRPLPAPARARCAMIDRLIAYCLRQPLMVMLALLLFIGAGIAAFRVLPVEAFPDVSDTQVTVVSLHPGRAAEEVEREVTMPLEVALSGIPHSVRVFSHTQFGLSMIILTFDDKADDYFARQQVLERLQRVELPEGVTPELEAMSSAVGEIYRYVLKGPHMTPTQLRTVQEWTMERSLRTVPGVADVISFGGFARTFQVKPDLDKLRDRGISLGEFAEALEKGSSNAGGGYVERGQQQFLIRGVGLMRSPADIGNVVVAQRGARRSWCATWPASPTPACPAGPGRPGRQRRCGVRHGADAQGRESLRRARRAACAHRRDRGEPAAGRGQHRAVL